MTPSAPSDPLPELGGFSVSLPVADLEASSAFYRTLGFEPIEGDGETWQVLRNGEANIGLFHGMFDAFILTFNPTDARAVMAAAEAADIPMHRRGDAPEGPTYVALRDPDGNELLFDQHDDGPDSDWRRFDVARIRTLIAHLEARLEALEAS